MKSLEATTMTENTQKEIRLIFEDNLGPDLLNVKNKTARGYLEDLESGKEVIDGKRLKQISTSIDDLVKWFNKFELNTIEISISAKIESGDILALIVKPSAECGIKLTFAPKKPVSKPN